MISDKICLPSLPLLPPVRSWLLAVGCWTSAATQTVLVVSTPEAKEALPSEGSEAKCQDLTVTTLVCVCVCVCVRERERERERKHMHCRRRQRKEFISFFSIFLLQIIFRNPLRRLDCDSAFLLGFFLIVNVLIFLTVHRRTKYHSYALNKAVSHSNTSQKSNLSFQENTTDTVSFNSPLSHF